MMYKFSDLHSEASLQERPGLGDENILIIVIQRNYKFCGILYSITEAR